MLHQDHRPRRGLGAWFRRRRGGPSLIADLGTLVAQGLRAFRRDW